MLDQFKAIIRLKGIWIPMFISLFSIMVSSFVLTEDLAYGDVVTYLEGQYLSCILFIAFPIYYLNKINLHYLNSTQNKQALYKQLIIYILALIFTILSLSILLVIFLIEDISFSFINFPVFLSNTLLYSTTMGLLFSFVLNLKNSATTLFVIYFFRPIIRILDLITQRFLDFNIVNLFPFEGTIRNEDLLLYCAYLVIFQLFSFKTHKSYYF